MSVTIHLADPDPAWAEHYRHEQERISSAIGHTALTVEHVGSTSVPHLAAKPIIDILLLVPDSRDEEEYLPALLGIGYAFERREPHWHEHRLLRAADPAVNLHVFSAHDPEAARMVLFRDHLRRDEADRRLYESTKRQLAQQQWTSIQHYADAKTHVVSGILARAAAAEPDA